jgi:hypothetical protein
VPTQSETLSPAAEQTSMPIETFSPANEAPRAGAWSDWALNGGTPWTVGVEEEVMLLDPADWSLASRADAVMKQLTGELKSHTSTETHGSALELRTDPHLNVAEGLAQLERLLGSHTAVPGLPEGRHPARLPRLRRLREHD